MNANDIHRAMQKLQTEDLVDMAESAASKVRAGSPDTLALSIQIDMALLVLMDRLPADVFAGICHDCDIDTDAGQAHH